MKLSAFVSVHLENVLTKFPYNSLKFDRVTALRVEVLKLCHVQYGDNGVIIQTAFGVFRITLVILQISE